MDFFDIMAPFYGKFHIGAKKSFKIINKLGKIEKTDRILDLGGGVGRVSNFFVDKVEEVTVVDSSSKMIKECRKNTKLKCILACAEKLPFPGDYFDKIIIVDAFHHFKNHKPACQEIRRVLKKDGRVVIEEFNPAKLFGWVIEGIEKILKMDSIFFTPASLATLLKQFNFRARIIDPKKSTYYLIAEKL